MNKILWCPIDLPKCPVIPDIKPDVNWYFWEFTKLTIVQNNTYAPTDFTEEVKTHYPSLVEWFKLFPYKNIRLVKINHQLSEVRPHIDFTKPDLDRELYANNLNNEPCGYRILLKGRRQNSLYLKHKDQKIYCNMPDDTDVYVLNSTTGLHGVEEENDRWIMYAHFEIDELKHKELINRSLLKYKEYAILA